MVTCWIIIGTQLLCLNSGLVYTDNGHTNVVGYSDIDWAGDASHKISTSGYCVLIEGNLISWKSRKKIVSVRSSTEEENTYI